MAVLEVGAEHRFTRIVTADMTPRHLLPTVVLSTPKMIALMEQASLDLVQPMLDDGQTSVGTHVNVSHQAAAREGEEVLFQSRLAAVEGRRLLFEVSAAVGDRLIGKGTHERFVVDRSRFHPKPPV
jgi:predicted thioesterase